MLRATVKRKTLIKRWPEKLTEVNAKFLPSAGVIVTGAAKRNAPVDQGILRGSINYQVNKDNTTVGTNINYATHVEYGTKKMTAQPYLRPALDKNRKKLVKLWEQLFGRVYGR